MIGKRIGYLAALVALSAMTSAASAGSDVINLKTRTGVAGRVEEHLRSLAQGNEREAELVSLTVHSRSGEVNGEVRIRSRQVSGKIFNPLSGKHTPIVAYDWTVRGRFRYNARTADGDAVLDLGRGV